MDTFFLLSKFFIQKKNSKEDISEYPRLLYVQKWQPITVRYEQNAGYGINKCPN